LSISLHISVAELAHEALWPPLFYVTNLQILGNDWTREMSFCITVTGKMKLKPEQEAETGPSNSVCGKVVLSFPQCP
jgi:hypothetical protein